MMWTEGFHVLRLDLLSSFPKGPALRTTVWHTFSRCLGHRPRLIVSHPTTERRNGLRYPDCVYRAAGKLNLKQRSEKASAVPILFTFRQCLISYFATHNRQTTNYRADIPRVLQRFSIMPLQARLPAQISCLFACVCAHKRTYMRARRRRSWFSFTEKRSHVQCYARFAHADVFVCVCVFYLTLCASLVCSCVQIQSDIQSAKGVKINALFSFAFTASNNSIPLV